MKFTPLGLAGAYRIDLEKREDDRGFFARLFCVEEFAAHGLPSRWVQMNTSMSREAGTLRGLHFQRSPMLEAKVVRCLKGAIFDVIVDLRSASATYGQWLGLELTSENRSMIYVPEGFAHGFQTLEPDTELLYFHSVAYSVPDEGGLHYADTSVSIQWPRPIKVISARDAAHPTLDQLEPII